MNNNSSPMDSKPTQDSFAHIATMRANLIEPKKIQLHSGIDGFNSPEAYGIYRNDGGDALGVVGSRFEPANLHLFLDTIVDSLNGCGQNFDLNKLTYEEYKGGAKVAFNMPLPTKEIKGSPMVGDVVSAKLRFSTGFDGLTKFNLGASYQRLWCANGCTSSKGINLSFKNTASAVGKMLLFCDQILSTVNEVDGYIQHLSNMATKEVSQSDIDKVIKAVTGYDMKEYNDLTTRKRNILDSINSSIAIEMANTRNTQFSLLQGITRYTTHDLAKGSEEAILYNGTVARYNENAHEAIMSLAN